MIGYDQTTPKKETAVTRIIALASALSLGFAMPASAALTVGAKAPDFTTQAVLGGKQFSFSLSQALKRGPVVLYFYPKAFTTGCTVEAHQFAEATADFNKAGATVVGVSADNIATLSRFSVEECRNKFAVAVATPEIINGYDAKLAPLIKISNRTSYVIAKNGQIAYTYSAMDADKHVANTLAAVRALQAKK
jgi:thioredoxin-dependent peroxiredoxin